MMKPALTAEEWAVFLDAEPHAIYQWGNAPYSVAYPNGDRWVLDGEWTRHELAAKALHGQPFGFTREDIDVLDTAIMYDPTTGRHGMALGAIRDRIEALLPPEVDPS